MGRIEIKAKESRKALFFGIQAGSYVSAWLPVFCGWIIDTEPNECYYMMLAKANQGGLKYDLNT